MLFRIPNKRILCLQFFFTILKVGATRIFFPDEKQVPVPIMDFECGIAPINLHRRSSVSMEVYHNGIPFPPQKMVPYFLNMTKERLEKEGFTISEEKVIYEDVLCNFKYSSPTSSGSYDCYNLENEFGEIFNRNKDLVDEDMFVDVAMGEGGVPARLPKSYFMAQLGQRKGNKTTWLCDGVLINREWVLSAAHCFANQRTIPNFLRLGDHNLTNSLDVHHDFFFARKITFDYSFAEIVPHPDFKINERYHDLVLIRIPRKIPRLATNVHPICLPFDDRVSDDLTRSDVTLIGWGATEYGGPKTDILQEVHLTVFNTSLCHKNYIDLPSIKTRYPKGMTKDTILCVGWKEGGRDACGGDSGAPLIYDGSFSNDTRTLNVDILVGIVSGGYGCGLKDYPGLYIPINIPLYLEWIKKTAF